jgi:hypothetical protein
MYHMFYFFARKPSLSSAGFHHHYLALHTQAGMRQAELGTRGGETRPRGMRRYIQNHRVHSLGGDSPFDAVSEVWGEEPENRMIGQLSVKEHPNSPFKRDEFNFIDLSRIGWMFTQDTPMMGGRPGFGNDPGHLSATAQDGHDGGGLPRLLG